MAHFPKTTQYQFFLKKGWFFILTLQIAILSQKLVLKPSTKRIQNIQSVRPLEHILQTGYYRPSVPKSVNTNVMVTVTVPDMRLAGNPQLLVIYGIRYFGS